MSVGSNDWPVLSRLLDAALLLPAHERNGWIEGLEGDDARLKPLLRELLAKNAAEAPAQAAPQAQPSSPVERRPENTHAADGDQTQARSTTERPLQPMDELGTALGRFVGGLSDVDELRGVFRDYLRRFPGQREAVSRWLAEAVEIGRVSTGTLLTIRDLIAPAGKDVSQPSLARVTTGGAFAALVDRAAGATQDPDRTGLRAGASPAPSMGSAGALVEGAILDGRYTLVAELGCGGMGTVFKARDRNREDFQDRHPYIALKVLSEEFKLHPDARMALQRETVRAQTLAHPNVITVYDFDYDGPHAYMTMELLEGQTLEDWLQGQDFPQTPFERRWFIVRSIGAGLAYAHEKGVVHSDLKPGNVFLCKSGVVKVMDFGIARPLSVVTGQADTTLFDAAERIGGLTPAYASAEQWNHESPDPRDDIYAFACVVYYLFSGRHPFDRLSAKTASETNLVPRRIDSLSRRQWEALRRGLALKRRDRVASVDEFLQQFAPRTWLQKNRLWLLGAAALAAAALLFFGAQSYREYVEDQALNAQLWPRADTPGKPLTPEEQRDIDDFLYLAQDSLHQAAQTTSIDGLSAIMSKGDNNLLEMLKRVRGLDPANAKALQLTSDAARLYASKAREQLSAGKLPDALRLVVEGQNFEHNRELLGLKHSICSGNAALCAAN